MKMGKLAMKKRTKMVNKKEYGRNMIVKENLYLKKIIKLNKKEVRKIKTQ